MTCSILPLLRKTFLCNRKGSGIC
uniref:Uncharacterized protein n=1 Tax=Rhizophora mucronata TaxID=61149 RepID=A0A2P2M8K0_RHIMU